MKDVVGATHLFVRYCTLRAGETEKAADRGAAYALADFVEFERDILRDGVKACIAARPCGRAFFARFGLDIGRREPGASGGYRYQLSNLNRCIHCCGIESRKRCKFSQLLTSIVTLKGRYVSR